MEFEWIDFYGKLADAILRYKNNRSALATLVSDAFLEVGLDLPTYGAPNDSTFLNTNARKKKNKNDGKSDHYWTIDLFDTIDPFSIFTRLNTFGDDKRKKLCGKLIEKLNITATVPANFNGVPTINAVKGVMTWCGPRDPSNSYPSGNLRQEDMDRIDMLWNFFELVLKIKEGSDTISNPLFIKYFDETNNYSDVANAKITNVLFCIAPNKFMTLDTKSLDYIKQLNIPGLPEGPSYDGSTYCEFLNVLNKYTEQENLDFTDISAQAYVRSNKSTTKTPKREKKQPESKKKDLEPNQSTSISNGNNFIYYGVPGCGKSYFIDHTILKGVDPKNIDRILFHPDYTYSDFVGQILPKLDKKGNPTYIFNKGPFTDILQKANKNKNEMHYLIIEEVNRGNAPAIFGDIFQLLDRDAAGQSRYAIKNSDIAESVYGDPDHDIKMPGNLSIICTMNTSDQNVFTLDTAFKRRWKQYFVEDNIDAEDENGKPICSFKDDYIKSNNDGSVSSITWKAFHDVINEVIAKGASTFASFEDRRLGTWFVSKDELEITEFTNKVIRYLWDDVKKTNSNIFNKNIRTFEDIYKVLKISKDNADEFFKEIFTPELYSALIGGANGDSEIEN